MSFLGYNQSTPEIILEVDGKRINPIRIEKNQNEVKYIYEHGLCVTGKSSTNVENIFEWKWSISNIGVSDSPVVTAFRPLYLDMPCKGRYAPVLHSSTGGLCDATFPPTSWKQLSRTIVTEGIPDPVTAGSQGGRSSNKDFPFFIMENFEKTGGYFIGVGWSGNWDLKMIRNQEKIYIDAGMTNLGLSIKPSEEFMQPVILIGGYEGNVQEGQRKLRNYVRDYIQPKLEGNRLKPLTFFDNYYGDRGNFNEESFLQEIPVANELGVEYLVIDGGWTGGGEDSQFCSLVPYIGTWKPHPVKFPEGFINIAKCAANNKRKMGIWFDIERANSESLSYKEHSHLFFPTPIDEMGMHLLRLDTKAGLEWAVSTVTDIINRLDAKWIRLDFNSDPEEIWEKSSDPDRKGAIEIHYIENLYIMYDSIMKIFPDVIIENCASGGRRIDLETLRRSHCNFISDHTQAESIIRYNIYGAGHWLPSNQINTSFAHAFLEPNRMENWYDELPACAYLSHFGGNFSISDRMKPLTTRGREIFRKYIDLFHTTSKCFNSDMCFIGRQEDMLEGPAGIAGTDPETGKKAVVLFGVNPGEAIDFVPCEFSELVKQKPTIGDLGDEQFISAFLWTDCNRIE